MFRGRGFRFRGYYGVKADSFVLNEITPVLLTYDEEANIGRTLSRLSWAKDVVVVDSGSTDGTCAILAKFPNTRVFSRKFDSHAGQWRYAVEATAISTEWILRLDADYIVGESLISELSELEPDPTIGAYRIGFDYAIFSRRLLASLYPANTVLLRRGCFTLRDKGHTEVWDVNGGVLTLKNRIVHDDWKGTGQWLTSQARYMQRELARLAVTRRGIFRLAAQYASPHADCDFFVLPVREGTDSKWSRGDILCTTAHGRRNGAFSHDLRKKTAEGCQRSLTSTICKALIVLKSVWAVEWRCYCPPREDCSVRILPKSRKTRRRGWSELCS